MTTMPSRMALLARSVGVLMEGWGFTGFYGCSSKTLGATPDGSGETITSSIDAAKSGCRFQSTSPADSSSVVDHLHCGS